MAEGVLVFVAGAATALATGLGAIPVFALAGARSRCARCCSGSRSA